MEGASACVRDRTLARELLRGHTSRRTLGARLLAYDGMTTEQAPFARREFHSFAKCTPRSIVANNRAATGSTWPFFRSCVGDRAAERVSNRASERASE